MNSAAATDGQPGRESGRSNGPGLTHDEDMRWFGEPLPRWRRWLMPAIMGAGYVERNPDGGTNLPRSPRDWVVDIILFGFAVLSGAGFVASDHGKVGTAMFIIDASLTVPACLLLWYRRRHPLVVGWLTIGTAVISDGACGAALVALLTVAVHCPARRTFPLAVLSVVDGVSLSIIYAEHNFNYGSLISWTVFTIATVCVGAYVRARRELVLSLRERAYRAEDEQQLRVREAQLAERARIAREMHDVLAHRISLLSVHAGALEYNPNASPEEIARAASIIRISARAAQEELREIVGVLRTGLGEDDAASADDVRVLPPQPTLADLERLVQESREAGMEVTLSDTLTAAVATSDRQSPAASRLSPTIGRTIYRLVQEALTNVRKHAPGHHVTITIGGDRERGVRVEVVNRPHVGQATSAPKLSHVGSGTGLVGLAERVTLARGELVTEQLPGGGFRLSATLPWSDADSDPDPDDRRDQ